MTVDMARLGDVLLRSSQAFAVFGAASLVGLAIARINRRGHSTGDAPIACHIAAAIGVAFGVLAVIGGVGHSVAVGTLAWTCFSCSRSQELAAPYRARSVHGASTCCGWAQPPSRADGIVAPPVGG